MLYTLSQGLIWDTTLPLYSQDDYTQEYIYTVLFNNAPYNVETEPARDGNTRPLVKLFDLGEHWLKVIFIYNNPADDREWMGLSDQKFEIYAK